MIVPTTSSSSSSSSSSSTTDVPFEFDPLPPPIQGHSDWRHFACGKLRANGVRFCCVSDVHSKTVSVAATVKVGASSDPRTLPGLAHFTEHLVFLGSDKYPQENAYKQFLAQHGGRSNASTSLHTTTFKFEIVANHNHNNNNKQVVETATDMFTRFFIHPLLRKEGVQREVYAVDSENSKNQVSDLRRRLQILKDMVVCTSNDTDNTNDTHYLTKFTTGNVHTLLETNNHHKERNDDDDGYRLQYLRQALLEFHAYHYQPHNLVVVIAGPQSLEELQQWILPQLALIKAPQPPPTTTEDLSASSLLSKDDCVAIRQLIHTAANEAPPYGYEEWSVPPSSQTTTTQTTLVSSSRRVDKNPYSRPPCFLNNHSNNQQPQPLSNGWPVQITIQPIKSMRKLTLYFPLPSVLRNNKDEDQSPVSILSHLLGHEGAGSIFATLQSKGWISTLTCGLRFSEPDFALLQLSMGLTLTGEDHCPEIIQVVFDYCHKLHIMAQTAWEEQQQQQQQQRGTNHHPDSSSSSYHVLARIWQEMAQINSIHFHQTSPGSVYELAPTLSRRILTHGTRKALSGGSLLDETYETVPLQDLVDFTSRLVPSNCFVERCSKAAWEQAKAHYEEQTTNAAAKNDNGSTDMIMTTNKRNEPWYGVDYFVSSIDKDIVAQWAGEAPPLVDVRDQLSLPSFNRYIPRSLDLSKDLSEEAKQGPRIDKDIDPPTLVINNPKVGRLWHRLDDRYALPKSVLTFLIRNAAVERSRDADGHWHHDTHAAIHSALLSGIFSEALAQETYDASLAGLHWNLSFGPSGIQLGCSGFSDRLPDLAIKLLDDFLSGSFLEQDAYFESSKDRILRSLRTFFESRRADADALYYRDLLLSSDSPTVDTSIQIAEAATLESTKAHHRTLLNNPEASVECLFTGNVSKAEAISFFDEASDRFVEAFPTTTHHPLVASNHHHQTWIPGEFERRLVPGCDVELHFQSQNPKEENGAVLMTYQSPIPGFRGDGLSHKDSLDSSAALRLISHMLREPMFDELRTKQTLGYIVSSYYDVGISNKQFERGSLAPLAVPVDFLVINVLSRKLSPPDVAGRIDDFLTTFRESLVNMPDSQIQHHASALSTKLLKPIQKLSSEANIHFGKIRRYGPELLASNHNNDCDVSDVDTTLTDNLALMPWDSVKTLARRIETLERDDLLKTWDNMILPRNRCRVVSCVYGSTFPLTETLTTKSSFSLFPSIGSKPFVVHNLDDILQFRKSLPIYNNEVTSRHSSFLRLHRLAAGQLSWLAGTLSPGTTTTHQTLLGVAAVALIGAGVAAGWTFVSGRSKKTTK